MPYYGGWALGDNGTLAITGTHPYRWVYTTSSTSSTSTQTSQQWFYPLQPQLNAVRGYQQLQQQWYEVAVRNDRLRAEERLRQLAALDRLAGRDQSAVRPGDDVAAARTRVAAAEQLRAAADRRARQLLREHLTDAQRAQLDATGTFLVTGGQTGRRYRIRVNGGIVANVEVLQAMADRPIHRLCCHLDRGLPHADHILAQKVMLESAENDFLRIANRHAA